VEGPCVPFIGVFLSDYTFMNEGEPSSIVSPLDKMVNIYKLGLETQLYKTMKTFQETWYTFYGVDVMWSWMDVEVETPQENLSERDLYTMAREIETREIN